MALRPTNVYRKLGEDFAYSVDTQLDAAALARAVQADVGTTTTTAADGIAARDEEEDTVWTAALRLGPDFEPSDVSVKLDDAGAFWVSAEAASRWQAGDFMRLRRRIQLPVDSVDAASARCWIEEDQLVVQADRLPPAARTVEPGRRSRFPDWPKASLADSHQRLGCLVKEAGGRRGSVKGHRGSATTKWTLDLALPEFSPDEVTVCRPPEQPGRLVVTAKHSWQGQDVIDSALRHEFRREIQPPVGVQLDQLATRFAANGVLHLEAPAPGLKVRRAGTVIGGLIGGASGGAGAKIASLTRDIRHHVGGGGGSSGGASTSAAATASTTGATSRSSPSREGREAGPASARSKNCVVQ